MNKRPLIIFSVVVGLIFLVLVKDYLKGNSNSLQTANKSKDSNYYLTSPWVTERVDWFFIPLPEKWNLNNKDIEKGKAKYAEISNEANMYELNLKDFNLICMYLDAKEGIYENWDLDKSATSMANQVLYNLKCKDISLSKLPPLENNLEVNYSAISKCTSFNFKSRIRGIRSDSHILIVCTFFKESDPNLEKIAERILAGIEYKYDAVSNAKN